MTQAAPAPSKPEKIRQVRKGQPAPFDGVIYNNQAHALLVAKMKGSQAKLKLELDFLKQRLVLQCKEQTRSLQIDLQTAQKKLQLETEARKQQRKYLLGELNTSKKTPWYREPMFTFCMGFLVAAVITGLSIWGAQSLSK